MLCSTPPPDACSRTLGAIKHIIKLKKKPDVHIYLGICNTFTELLVVSQNIMDIFIKRSI